MSPLSSSLAASIARMRPADIHEARMQATFARFSRPQTLSDGSTGWPVRAPRGDDCFTAAVATALQIPIDDVPDPRLDERLDAGETPEDVNRQAWSELNDWLSERGLKMVAHKKVPARRRRWIGVIEIPGMFHSHSLVMSRAEVIFDPIWHATAAGFLDGRWVRRFGPEHVTAGLSFAAINTPKDKDQRPWLKVSQAVPAVPTTR